MIDRHDFVKWVRTQDTRLAPKLQAMLDFYLRARASQARTTKPENAGPLYSSWTTATAWTSHHTVWPCTP